MPRINTIRSLVLVLPFSLALGVAHATPAQSQAVPVSAATRSLIADPTYGLPVPHLLPPAKDTSPAHWIWLGPVVGDQQLEARTVFTLQAKPKTAQVWVTADDAFTLFINGHRVDGTQAIEQGWNQAHQDNAAPYLRAGKNVIAVEGINKSGGAAGVVAELDVNGAQSVVSGSQWKVLLSNAPPTGWQEVPFDDSAWQAATDEGAIGTSVWGRNVNNWPRLEAADWYMAHRAMKPVAAESLSGADAATGLSSLLHGGPAASVVVGPASAASPKQILLDFGTELSGRIAVAGTPGAKVEVHTGETRDGCLRIIQDPLQRGIDNSGPWTLTLSGGDAQTTPYTAFRYALLTFTGGQPVTLTQADCDFKYYPVAYKGAFACSDPLLTKIWYTGAYTAHLCMQEDIWDAPKRDRGLWIGDLHVTGETINNAFGDRFLMEKTLAGGRADAQGGRPDTELPAKDINGIPGYTAAWFGGMADFYRHNGDLAFLQSQHQNILTLLAFQQTEFNAQNLFSNPKNVWDFCDWAPEYVQHTPQTVAATDLFDIYGVRQAVFLLRALGDTANAEKYNAWADALTQAAQSSLVDPKTQTFGDRVQGNAMAVFAEVTTPEQQAQIYKTVLKTGSPAWVVPTAGDLSGAEVISPYYGNYVLGAYGKMGQYQAGIDLMRRYWGAMLARGTKTWWEQFDPTFPQDMNVVLSKMSYLSFCHGWSSGPTSYLTERILGVQPTAGGFSRVLIQPELGDLAWVKGTVPTPHGPIQLHVMKAQQKLVCTLSLPSGVQAIVRLLGKTVTLTHAGEYTLMSENVATAAKP